MSKRYKPVKNFFKGIDLPDTAISDAASIEIIGDMRVVVEQTKGILEYENERIRINIGKYIAVITGCNLTLSSYSDNIIVIDGKIKNICLE